jgi:4-hydroxy-tetrahydrodipicolinate synthase
MAASPFHGSIAALITPFENGRIDERRYQDLVKWQIVQGTHGLVASATTGEAPTLSDDECALTIRLCREVANSKVPVMAGCGSNNTAHAIHLTQQAEKLGADAALHVPPYYNKPTQEGVYQHIKAIHDHSNIPIFLYNVPGRTVVAFTPEVTARLAELPRVAGIKDCAGVERVSKFRATCKPGFRQLTGDDPVTLPYLAMGGEGCVSVTANIAPALCAAVHNAWSAGDVATAQKINDQLMPLHEALFCETSPGPVKYAAALLGLCRYEFRLPMVPVAKANEKIVEEAMRKVGLITADAALKVAARA